MRIQDQVCNLEQAKKLKELGVDQLAFFIWDEFADQPVKINYRITQEFTRPVASAFTVAELGLMLPVKIRLANHDYTFRINRYKSSSWEVKYRAKSSSKYLLLHQTNSQNESEARAAMLIYLLENNIIKVNEVNQRLA